MQNHPEFDAAIKLAAQTNNLDANLIRAVIEHESGWRPEAVGDNGAARGLMQMHALACEEVGADFNEMFDPAKNIAAGAAYLAKWVHKYGDWFWALGAYNQGPTVMTHAYTYADAVMNIYDGVDTNE